jgi:hypothetical protein
MKQKKLTHVTLISFLSMSLLMSIIILTACFPLQINVPVACPILRANFTAAEKDKDKKSKPEKKGFFRQ